MRPLNSSRPRAASVIAALALTVFGIGAGLAPAGASWAQATMIHEAQVRTEALEQADVDTAAVILVANPDFKDPLWRGTVLIASPLPNGGHFGVIINRPTELKLGQLFPEHGPSQKVVDPVYFGGPFHANLLVAVVRSAEVANSDSVALTSDLTLAIGVETIDRIIEQKPASARYYIGVVLWRPGELKLELAKQLWSVHGASTETVFHKDMEHLWDELSVAKRGTRVSAPLPTLALAR